MELVPILSLIVLVATISTFMLSIGAYVYYKMREKKGRTAKAAQPVAIEAELIAPAPLMGQRRFGQTGLKTYAEEQYNEDSSQTGTKSEDVTRIADRTGMRMRAGNTFTQEQNQTRETKITGYNESPKKKFMRYTADGYIDPSEDKNTSEEKLRWR